MKATLTIHCETKLGGIGQKIFDIFKDKCFVDELQVFGVVKSCTGLYYEKFKENPCLSTDKCKVFVLKVTDTTRFVLNVYK